MDPKNLHSNHQIMLNIYAKLKNDRAIINDYD